jgi:hypothetical protein
VYTLLNKKLNRRLIHPKFGLWSTPDLIKAEEMLKCCHDYVGDMKDDFIIIHVETGVECPNQLAMG